MTELEKMFPSLALFSDLNWQDVTAEYESQYNHLSFPEYLQHKASEGDCPPYLFELAFYELAMFEAQTSEDPFPHVPGVYLNPTALFLSLDFDVHRMILEAKLGNVQVIERPQVLCIFRSPQDDLCTLELTQDQLATLEKLEDGPQGSLNFLVPEEKDTFAQLTKWGLIINLLSP